MKLAYRLAELVGFERRKLTPANRDQMYRILKRPPDDMSTLEARCIRIARSKSKRDGHITNIRTCELRKRQGWFGRYTASALLGESPTIPAACAASTNTSETNGPSTR